MNRFAEPLFPSRRSREGGVKVGLPRDVATLLAAQTMLGAARELISDE